MPPTGKWTTTQVVIMAIVAAAAAILLFKYLGPDGPGGPPQNLQDDEERPPVIISNGSIDFEPLRGHPNTGGNKWKQPNAADKKRFIDTDLKGAPVTGFLVDTIPQVKATCTYNGNAVGTKPPFFGTSVIVTYGGDNYGPKTASISIENDAMLLVLQDDADLQNNYQKVYVPDPGSGIKTKVMGFSVGKYVCTLADQGQTQIKISQLK